MPKRAVRILCVATVLAFPFAAEGADQGRADSKPAAQHPAPPPPQTQSEQDAQSAKTASANRDVCDKHPNLKQCS